MELKNKPLRLKSLEEIVAKTKEVIARHRRKFLRRFLRPCPQNCQFATMIGNDRVTGCTKCGSRNPEQCRRPGDFSPINTKEELYREFQAMLRDPEVLFREYRDIFALLWVLGAFDTEEGNVDERVVQAVQRKKDGG